MASQPTGPTPAPPDGEQAPARSPIELVVEENKTKFVLTVLGLLVAVCAVFMFFYLAQRKADDAAAALASANTVEGFNVVALEHTGTVAGGNALLRSADLLVTDDPDGASKKLQHFLDQYPGHPRYAQGLVALGTVDYQQSRFDEAAARFQQVLDEHRESDIAPLALVLLGDIAWDQGETENAAEFYERVAPEFPANAYIDRTDERLRLLRRTPPTEPSDRQKALKEEEERLRQEREEAAKKAAEEAAKVTPEPLQEPVPVPVPVPATEDGAAPPDGTGDPGGAADSTGPENGDPAPEGEAPAGGEGED